MKNLILSLITLITLILAYLYLQYERATKYTYSLNKKASNIISLGIRNININLVLDLGNKSDFDLIVSNYKIDIFLNGSKVAHVEDKRKQIIKSNSISQFNIGVFFNPSEVYKNNKNKLVDLTSDIAMDQKNVKFKIIGTMNAGLSFYNYGTVPIEADFTLSDITEK